MNKNSIKTYLSLFLCLVLIAAMALSMTGCKAEEKQPEQPSGTFTDGQTLGSGASSFALTVTDREGKQTKATVKTDEETVGNALLALGVIAGEQQELGIYVKTVNGQTLDYEQDGMYWAFYINGEYAMTGIDKTPIEDGAAYELKAE